MSIFPLDLIKDHILKLPIEDREKYLDLLIEYFTLMKLSLTRVIQ